MSHSFYKVWLHLVFVTYKRQFLITPNLEQFLYKHLQFLLMEASCFPVAINGMPDHIHLLFQMTPTKSISDLVRNLKGLSSHTINTSGIANTTFAWQTGYAVFSVSESQVERVKNYIINQKQHHQKIKFDAEFEQIIRAHNLTPEIDR
jgi:putative transposase